MGDGPDVAGWTDEFVEEVFPAEYATVMERRREVARRAGAPEPPDRVAEGKLVPSTELRLFGLAFSGGGIRTATFNLGVTQALAKVGLLPRFDYLSTVSGGGYIGSCLSSLLNRPSADSRWTKAFPLFLESGRQEPIALRHLRDRSEYLVNEGTWGYFGIVAVMLRGMLVNTLSMVPFVIALVGLTHLTFGAGLSRLGRSLPDGYPPFLATGVALALLLLAIVAFPLLSWLIEARRGDRDLEQRGRGVSLYAVLLQLVVALAIAECLPLVLRWYHRSDSIVLPGLTSLSAVASALPRSSASDGQDPGLVDKLRKGLILLVASAAGPLILLMVYLALGELVLFPAGLDPATIQLAVYGGGAALLVYVLLFLDANSTSVHQYYRDRLSEAYLFQVDSPQAQAVRPTDPLRLSELNAEGTVAPYHLVNTAMNMQGSHDPALRGRQSDFFLFSKHFCGSVRTGYCRTPKLEAADHHLSLGTALAISGAAAAPNMGSFTMRSLSLLMTLLNVRLGYWLPHPQRAAADKVGLWGDIGVGLSHLVTEALSRPDDRGRHVNVSDGGHIENLGIYELLRRRCRVIVCGDGEADPKMTFTGLATIIRYAATDMGVHIDINLDGLAKDEDGRSKRNYAIGRIDYGDGELGWLLYIKASMGERELPYIEQYRDANPDFPHQSTADQFFDEAQFEAYRALGFKIGLRTCQGLTELQEKSEDPALLDFSIGEGLESLGGSDQDELEGGLARRFLKAADSNPPW